MALMLWLDGMMMMMSMAWLLAGSSMPLNADAAYS
jgi:hypothetical protein